MSRAHRILLLEDEEHLAFTLEFNLIQEGYEVDVAKDCATARAYADRSYDLMVLDMMLPDGSGLDICRERRARGDRACILFLTAKGEPDDIVEGLQAGADDYLAKPFALRELLGRIQALLRRATWISPPPSADTLKIGDIEINFKTFEVRNADGLTGLTELEIRLLRFFADNANRVVSRAELLEKVWEVSGQSNTRTIDNFMVRLRRIFEKDPSRPRHFLTVRGVGYRFVTLNDD